MKVAAYVRVSTEDQAKEGFSLEAQEERLRAYAVAQGWRDLTFYREEGKSGRNATRPAYRAMMEAMDSWDLLLVVKMDRIHRNSKNFMGMMEDLQKRGKKFASVTEAFDTSTAMGRFVMDIIQRIAQLESETIGERVYVGMEQKAKEGGGSLGGHAPYGYERVDGKLLPVEPAAEEVRRMFRYACKARTFADVGTEFGWSRFKVRRMLTNPVYAGITRWHNVLQRDTHPSLVTAERFNEIQERLLSGVRI